MSQGKKDISSDVMRNEPNLKEQLDIISEMELLVKSGAVQHLVIAVKLMAAQEGEIAILTDEINLYDYHALIGYMQTDAAMRVLAVDRLEKKAERMRLLA